MKSSHASPGHKLDGRKLLRDCGVKAAKGKKASVYFLVRPPPGQAAQQQQPQQQQDEEMEEVEVVEEERGIVPVGTSRGEPSGSGAGTPGIPLVPSGREGGVRETLEAVQDFNREQVRSTRGPGFPALPPCSCTRLPMAVCMQLCSLGNRWCPPPDLPAAGGCETGSRGRRLPGGAEAHNPGAPEVPWRPQEVAGGGRGDEDRRGGGEGACMSTHHASLMAISRLSWPHPGSPALLPSPAEMGEPTDQ